MASLISSIAVGRPGFLRVLDERTLGFADFRGNRQYVSQGNLSENPKAHIFLIDHARRQRIKIWGTARVVEDDPALLERLRPEGYAGTPEQAVLFTIAAWDANCPQHIPQLIPARDVAAALAERDRKDPAAGGGAGEGADLGLIVAAAARGTMPRPPR